MLDLNSEDLTDVLKLLKKHIPHMFVWAFGSRVNGTAHAGSDLDLVVINPLNPDKPQANLVQLSSAFAESNLPIKIDILDWALIPDTFRDVIKHKYEIIQKP